MRNTGRSAIILSVCIGAAVALGLYLCSLYSYILFHSLVEIVTIAIALTLFILTWNTREYIANGYLRFLGIGYGFIALLDLVHTLAYAGMGVFQGYGSNLPTQLWIAARYLQAVTLIAAPFLVARRMNDKVAAALFAVAVAALATAIFSGAFPACYIDGKGLTPFKVESEYAISVVLLISLVLLYRRKKHFDGNVFSLVVASILCTILSELCFTAYISVYGFANMAGHFAKLGAFYLIYRAIVRTGLKEPYKNIFESLRQSEMALRESRDTIEGRVIQRTADLSASEAKYRQLLTNIRAAVVVHGADTKIRISNPMAQEILGLSADQLQGMAAIDPYWNYLREDGTVLPQEEHPIARTLASGVPIRDAIVGIRRPDRDAATWTLVNTEISPDEGGGIDEVVVTFVDVTERKRTEEALKKSEALLNDVQRLTRVGGWEFDVKLGKIVWTEELYRIHEIPNDPSIDHIKLSLSCYRPEDREIIHDAFRRACEQGESYDLEFPFTTCAGNPLWIRTTAQPVFEGGKVARLTGNLMDITERKRAEDELRISEGRYRMAQTISHTGNWEYNIQTNLLLASDEAKRIYEFDPDANSFTIEEVEGCITERERVHQALIDLIQKNRPYNLEFEIRAKKTGKPKIIASIAELHLDEQGRPLRVVGVIQDITEHKIAEDQIRRLNENLEDRVDTRTSDLQKKSTELKDNQTALMNIVEDLNEKTMELERANAKIRELDRLKSMFIASMSHELRTPLNSIIGFSSIILDEWVGPLTAEQKQNLGTVLRSGRHLLSLINDVIDVSKIEAGMIDSIVEDFDLLSVVMEAVETVKGDIEKKGLELLVKVSQETLRADRRRFLQSVINLVSNAAKYTLRGSIDIRAESTPDGSTLTLTVEDTGIGIKEEDLGKLFAPFVRLGGALGNTIPGTGLGLYLTKKLVTEILKGELFVESSFGVGSRFSIRVPRGR